MIEVINKHIQYSVIKVEIDMLRSNQEEQIKYFYLDRKFGSGNLREIGDALDEVDLFLGKMKKIDLINSLVMRMLDLIQTAKSFHIKHRVSIIFRHHSQILLAIHSRDEIAVVISKCLKGSDQYTRIVALQMITPLASLFLKDIALYHTLLSKIPAPNHSRIQKKHAIISLTQLLSNSPQLSKLITKNITNIQTQYQIPLHVLIYLLTYVTIDSHLQKQILEDVLALITNKQGQIQSKKKEIYYYEKLVMNYAGSNYRIVALYQNKLQTVLPRIQNDIAKIKSIKYPFMKNSSLIRTNQVQQLKIQVFLDELYECKKEGNFLQQYQQTIKKLIIEAINKPTLLLQRLLLVYYLQQNCSKVDRQILSLLQHNLINMDNKSLLKKVLVIGLFHSSKLLLSRVIIEQQNYIFFQLYTQFKISDSIKSLQQLLEITQILSQKLFNLLALWTKINSLFQLKQANLSQEVDFSTLYNEISQDHLTLKQSSSSFPQQLQLISIILRNKQLSLCELKSKCYYLLPSNILYNESKFWFAYLHKQTILSLFHTRL